MSDFALTPLAEHLGVAPSVAPAPQETPADVSETAGVTPLATHLNVDKAYPTQDPFFGVDTVKYPYLVGGSNGMTFNTKTVQISPDLGPDAKPEDYLEANKKTGHGYARNQEEAVPVEVGGNTVPYYRQIYPDIDATERSPLKAAMLNGGMTAAALAGARLTPAGSVLAPIANFISSETPVVDTALSAFGGATGAQLANLVENPNAKDTAEFVGNMAGSVLPQALAKGAASAISAAKNLYNRAFNPEVSAEADRQVVGKWLKENNFDTEATPFMEHLKVQAPGLISDLATSLKASAENPEELSNIANNLRNNIANIGGKGQPDDYAAAIRDTVVQQQGAGLTKAKADVAQAEDSVRQATNSLGKTYQEGTGYTPAEQFGQDQRTALEQAYATVHGQNEARWQQLPLDQVKLLGGNLADVADKAKTLQSGVSVTNPAEQALYDKMGAAGKAQGSSFTLADAQAHNQDISSAIAKARQDGDASTVGRLVGYQKNFNSEVDRQIDTGTPFQDYVYKTGVPANADMQDKLKALQGQYRDARAATALEKATFQGAPDNLNATGKILEKDSRNNYVMQPSDIPGMLNSKPEYLRQVAESSGGKGVFSSRDATGMAIPGTTDPTALHNLGSNLLNFNLRDKNLVDAQGNIPDTDAFKRGLQNQSDILNTVPTLKPAVDRISAQLEQAALVKSANSALLSQGGNVQMSDYLSKLFPGGEQGPSALKNLVSNMGGWTDDNKSKVKDALASQLQTFKPFRSDGSPDVAALQSFYDKYTPTIRSLPADMQKDFSSIDGLTGAYTQATLNAKQAGKEEAASQLSKLFLKPNSTPEIQIKAALNDATGARLYALTQEVKQKGTPEQVDALKSLVSNTIAGKMLSLKSAGVPNAEKLTNTFSNEDLGDLTTDSKSFQQFIKNRSQALGNLYTPGELRNLSFLGDALGDPAQGLMSSEGNYMARRGLFKALAVGTGFAGAGMAALHNAGEGMALAGAGQVANWVNALKTRGVTSQQDLLAQAIKDPSGFGKSLMQNLPDTDLNKRRLLSRLSASVTKTATAAAGTTTAQGNSETASRPLVTDTP